ncbi:MAG: SDR family NAD(P)-dependent oxidoreductase [Nitrospiria bacterium]
MKKAIIIGASSGIGRELAKVLSQAGYVLGLAGRRSNLLAELQKELPNESFVKYIDVSQTEKAMVSVNELFSDMNDVDLVIISSGVGFINSELQWPQEKETIDVNVSGFAAMANVVMRYFLQKGSGHLLGISSIAAIRGDGSAPAYNASKAFISNYLEGLRHKGIKSGLPITITDIQPGFVDTAMAKGEGQFWVASPQKAATQIFNAIRKKKNHAYITKRWKVIGWALKTIPDFLYNKL